MLRRFGGKVSILTKSDLVLRDLDLLKGMPAAEVGVTVSCVDERVSSAVEPGAPPPERRFQALAELSSSGVDCYLMVAPVIPGVSDSEEMLVETVSRARDAGVRRIMWDMYNPKPIAHSRLVRTLESSGIGVELRGSRECTPAVRKVLVRACGASDIRLVDAF